MLRLRLCSNQSIGNPVINAAKQQGLQLRGVFDAV